MTIQKGNYKIIADFKLDETALEADILCDDVGDWVLDRNGDWLVATGERAFHQDLSESLALKLFEDILDIQEGNELHQFVNATFTAETALQIKQKVLGCLEKDDRIIFSTLEVSVERNF